VVSSILIGDEMESPDKSFMGTAVTTLLGWTSEEARIHLRTLLPVRTNDVIHSRA